MTRVAILSCSTNKYVSLDGRGVRCPATPDGGGSVGPQSHVQSWEIFVLHEKDGAVGFESSAFGNIYLRFDASQMRKQPPYPNGAGVVNGQCGMDEWEQFKIKQKGDSDIVYIESKAFPGKFLRAAGNTVNGQNTTNDGNKEEFKIIMVGV